MDPKLAQRTKAAIVKAGRVMARRSTSAESFQGLEVGVNVRFRTSEGGETGRSVD